MQAAATDTDAEAERVQVELLRRAGAARRARMAFSLSATTIALARRAVGRTLPGASSEEIGARFVELNYGRDVAAGLRQRLRAGGL
jgi:hypothetical protein